MEQPVQFSVDGDIVRGVLHTPGADAARHGAGVVFLHGWSGCRLGPHRMFVKTARQLARRGFTCLRFDFRGRGDSDGSTSGASIESMIKDARAAVRWMLEQDGIESMVILGICSGGKVAIGTAVVEPAATHLVLWSGEALAPLRATTAGARKSMHAIHQYALKALRPSTWRKVLTGRANLRLVRKAVIEHEAPDTAERKEEATILDAFRSYGGQILFVYGTNDPDTKHAAENYAAFCRRAGIPNEFHHVEGANHSFYSLDWEETVIRRTEEWLTAHVVP